MTKTGVRTALIDRDAARAAAAIVLDYPGADAVEVLVAASDIGLTRFANSQIIQNTVRNDLKAFVRVAIGERVAVAATNQLDDEALRTAAGRALDAARAAPPDPDFPGLPRPEEVGRAEPVLRWDEDTAAAAPAERAEAVAAILAATRPANAAGIFETSAHSFSIVSSLGVDCFDAYTRCVTTCLADLDGATGWGDASSHARHEVDVDGVGRGALDKAEAGRGAVDAEPGVFEVVLEPAAVANMIEYLAYAGFGAKQVIEGDSFLSERAGQQVAAPAVTVADDVWHPASVGIGFDLEGVPKKRVPVIERGIATGPVTDLRTAARLGTQPTGHYSGSPEQGPYAFNLLVEEGDRTTEDLVAGVARGFLVTRFWYVNILDRPVTLLTGMTRDGTFRISNGEVAEPVHNFRFTQNVLDGLAAVTGVGSELHAFAPEYGSFGSTVVPALRIGEFNFSSRTSH